MYAILNGGGLVALCDRPRYIKKNKTSGVYVETTEDEADGISVNGDLYNINGKTTIPGAPDAVIVHKDVSEYVFRNRLQIAENQDAAQKAIAGAEDALCVLDTEAGERLAAVEMALCELDSMIGGEVKKDE